MSAETARFSIVRRSALALLILGLTGLQGARADSTIQPRWYASLFDSTLIQVDVDTRPFPVNQVAREVYVSIRFFDAQQQTVGSGRYAFTDAQTPALEAGRIYRRYFVHPYPAASNAIGFSLLSSLSPSGANLMVKGVSPEPAGISDAASTVLGSPPGSAGMPQGVSGELQPALFRFPGGGTKNRNQAIGPFCCSGETAIVLFQDGQPAGFVHFFSWGGQARNVAGSRSVAPSFKVQVSGAENLADARSPQVQAEVEFSAKSLRNPGATRRVRAGGLEFRVTSIGAETMELEGQTYFYMDTPRIEVRVTPAQ